ncbi:hypothetical protein [Faecalimonas sp.]
MINKKKEKLEKLGIEVGKGIEELGEEVYLLELSAFVKSMDFMKIGRAVSAKQWPLAMITLRRMMQKGKELKIKNMEMVFLRLRKEIGEKNGVAVKNTLALLTQKRVQMIKILQEEG